MPLPAELVRQIISHISPPLPWHQVDPSYQRQRRAALRRLRLVCRAFDELTRDDARAILVIGEISHFQRITRAVKAGRLDLQSVTDLTLDCSYNARFAQDREFDDMLEQARTDERLQEEWFGVTVGDDEDDLEDALAEVLWSSAREETDPGMEMTRRTASLRESWSNIVRRLVRRLLRTLPAVDCLRISHYEPLCGVRFASPLRSCAISHTRFDDRSTIEDPAALFEELTEWMEDEDELNAEYEEWQATHHGKEDDLVHDLCSLMADQTKLERLAIQQGPDYEEPRHNAIDLTIPAILVHRLRALRLGGLYARFHISGALLAELASPFANLIDLQVRGMSLVDDEDDEIGPFFRSISTAIISAPRLARLQLQLHTHAAARAAFRLALPTTRSILVICPTPSESRLLPHRDLDIGLSREGSESVLEGIASSFNVLNLPALRRLDIRIYDESLDKYSRDHAAFKSLSADCLSRNIALTLSKVEIAPVPAVTYPSVLPWLVRSS